MCCLEASSQLVQQKYVQNAEGIHPEISKFKSPSSFYGILDSQAELVNRGFVQVFIKIRCLSRELLRDTPAIAKAEVLCSLPLL
jgi:hypothetical protein